tara:strand:+ start:312 stop:548 length:237 start_codon:yes stop_codon:yes gene_type:complete
MTIREILRATTQDMVSAKTSFAKALLVPMTVFILLDFLPNDLHIVADIAVALTAVLLYTAICIPIHRIVLLGSNAVPE